MGFALAAGVGLIFTLCVFFVLHRIKTWIHSICAGERSQAWQEMEGNEEGAILAAESNVSSMESISLTIPYYWMHLFSSCLPQLGLLHSLALAIGYHWQPVTSTVCLKNGSRHIPKNYLPSISASIGDFAISRQVWGYWIGLYIGTRLPSILFFYYSYAPLIYRQPGSKRSISMILKIIFHLVEQASLLGLTVVSSKENLVLHQIFFAAFWAASVCCLIVTTWMSHCVVRASVRTDAIGPRRLRIALSWRRRMLFIHLASSVSAFYWYFAHEVHCDDYYYTYFSVSEWALVFSNIYFHIAEMFETYDIAIHLHRHLVEPVKTNQILSSLAVPEKKI